MKKNRWIGVGMFLIIFLSMIACGGGNTLLSGADVENSALSLYYYDGMDTVRGHIFDKGQRKEILDKLSAVSVKPVEVWSPTDVTAPIYGIMYINEKGVFESAVWSNDLWITERGEAYRFDYDVASLYNSYEWQSVDTWSGSAVLPCSHALTNVDGVWDPTWMTPATELITAEGHAIELVEWGDSAVTVKLINQSGEEWMFGEYYHLEVNLDGTWYRVPTAPGENWVVHDLAYILPDGEDMEMTYSLMCYGDLPAGHYRLVAEAFEEGLAVEIMIGISDK